VYKVYEAVLGANHSKIPPLLVSEHDTFPSALTAATALAESWCEGEYPRLWPVDEGESWHVVGNSDFGALIVKEN